MSEHVSLLKDLKAGKNCSAEAAAAIEYLEAALESANQRAEVNENKLDELESLRERLREVTDEHHTMQELYDHRHALFLNLLTHMPLSAPVWKSKRHEDGTMYDDWFIAGVVLPDGPISYHMPMTLWDYCHVPELDKAPHWDGYTPQDVVNRLMALLGYPIPTDQEEGKHGEL